MKDFDKIIECLLNDSNIKSSNEDNNMLEFANYIKKIVVSLRRVGFSEDQTCKILYIIIRAVIDAGN